jgi:transposase
MGTRRRFSAEFKRDAVELVRTTGKPIAEIARDLGVGESSLGYWVTRDRKLRGEHLDQAPMTDDDREELKRLRKRVAELEMEREILKRATAFWVKESSS